MRGCSQGFMGVFLMIHGDPCRDVSVKTLSHRIRIRNFCQNPLHRICIRTFCQNPLHRIAPLLHRICISHLHRTFWIFPHFCVFSTFLVVSSRLLNQKFVKSAKNKRKQVQKKQKSAKCKCKAKKESKCASHWIALMRPKNSHFRTLLHRICIAIPSLDPCEDTREDPQKVPCN